VTRTPAAPGGPARVAAGPPQASAPARPAARPVVLLAAVAVLLGGFLAARLALGGIGGFVLAGGDFVDPARAPAELSVDPGGGYDGQFVYRLALDPLTTAWTGNGITFDAAGYRQQRIATAALAWLLALLPGISTGVALLTVNALAVLAAAWFGMRLAADAGRHPAWGLAVGLPAFLPLSVGRDLTEPLAWAAILAGLWCARRGRWPAAAAALTVAVLARETSLLVVAGLGAAAAYDLLRRRSPVPAPRAGGRGGASRAVPAGRRRAAVRLGWLTVPVAVALAWQAWLWQVWGSPAFGRGPGNNLAGVPVLGVLETVLTGVPAGSVGLSTDPLVRLAWGAERVALLALICYAAVTLARRASRTTPGEQVAWALAVLLALSLRGWSYDVQFLRAAAEATGLSLLVALGSPGRAGRLVLAGGALVTACVTVQYALLP